MVPELGLEDKTRKLAIEFFQQHNINIENILGTKERNLIQNYGGAEFLDSYYQLWKGELHQRISEGYTTKPSATPLQLVNRIIIETLVGDDDSIYRNITQIGNESFFINVAREYNHLINFSKRKPKEAMLEALSTSISLLTRGFIDRYLREDEKIWLVEKEYRPQV